MEETQKDSSSASGTAKSGSKLLRYPLRSAAKTKEEKPPLSDASNASANRKKTASNVNKSISVLDLSGKEKAAKPTRRLSVPSKSTLSPSPKQVGNITPISQAKARKSVGNLGKNDAQISDVSTKRKFTVLASASYWQSQIKVSEAAAKHFISLGFFKLALEAGCEPVQLLRDELKSYVRRHDLNQYAESVKELFERYNIIEDYEQLQVSETCSHVSEIRSSGDNTRKSKPQNIAVAISFHGKDAKKESTQKNEPITNLRRSLKMDSFSSKTGSKSGSRGIIEKKRQNPKNQKSNEDHGTLEKKVNESVNEQGVNKTPSAEHDEHQEKSDVVKNMDEAQTEDPNIKV